MVLFTSPEPLGLGFFRFAGRLPQVWRFGSGVSSWCLPSHIPTADQTFGTVGWITIIGTLNEGSLHASLKRFYGQPGDRYEVELKGFVVDIVRGEDLIEIQTGSFGSMGTKLDELLADHRIMVVYPVSTVVTLIRPGMADRRSPKRGALHDVFNELVSLPTMLDHPNFSLEVVLVREERVKVHDPALRRKRGGWRTVDRRLESVEGVVRFDQPGDLDSFLPDELPDIFTTAHIAAASPFDRSLAQKVAYCLRGLGRIEAVGRDAAGYQYRRSEASRDAR